MPYLLPFVMLFGFLTIKVARGDDFAVVMPLVLLALTMWTFIAVVKSGAVTRVISTLFVGFVALAIFSRFDVVTYSALGPQLLGAPLVLVLMWTALVCGVTAIAERKIERENREVVAWIEVCVLGGGIGALWSLVVNPALFSIGVFAYRSSGLYYGVPFLHMAFWSVSVAAGALAFVWLSDHEERALPLGSIAGPLLLVGYATGACIAVGAWVPAVLGLVLAQLGFRAMYYL
ncbi:MAG: carotenoid biosynthesis protein [Patescibacteria group bacterium]